MPEQRNSRTLILRKDVSENNIVRATANVNPRMDIVVPSSGDSEITMPGGKCDHGVYIPANSILADPDLAPCCSICRPYEIIARKHSSYKA